MSCRETTQSLGVYLVGALEPAERAEVEAHLRDCPACRDELAQLASLPSMLAQLTVEDFAIEPLDVPEDLFDRVAARAREEDEGRRSGGTRRYRRLMAVAAAVVIVAGVGIGSVEVLDHGGNGSSGITATTQVASATQGGVTMRVVLAAQQEGTGLRVAVSGLPRNEHCWLVAVAKDGSRELAGRWDATYLGKAQEIGSTTIPQDQLAQLVLLGTHGQQLVTVPV
jgi:Putative zinc-finger